MYMKEKDGHKSPISCMFQVGIVVTVELFKARRMYKLGLSKAEALGQPPGYAFISVMVPTNPLHCCFSSSFSQ